MARLSFRAALLVAVALLGSSSAATAATLFTDRFNYDSSDQLSWKGSGVWSVISGTVDYLHTPNVHGISCTAGSGGCVDLDGSMDDSGVLNRNFSASAGQTLAVTANFSGSQRQFEAGNSRNVANNVTFGIRDSSGAPLGSTTILSLAWDTPSIEFTLDNLLAANSGLYSVFFETSSNDSVGLILDNVSVAAVPLPAAAWLLLSGIGSVALFARRRRVEPVPA